MKSKTALVVLVPSLIITGLLAWGMFGWQVWSPEQKETEQTFWIPDGADVELRSDVKLPPGDQKASLIDIEEELAQEGFEGSLLVMPMLRHPDTEKPAVRYWLSRPPKLPLKALIHMPNVDSPRFQGWDVTLTNDNTQFQYISSRRSVGLYTVILAIVLAIAGIVALISAIVMVKGPIDTSKLQDIAQEAAREASSTS